MQLFSAPEIAKFIKIPAGEDEAGNYSPVFYPVHVLHIRAKSCAMVAGSSES
jgi:hypothetical protein